MKDMESESGPTPRPQSFFQTQAAQKPFEKYTHLRHSRGMASGKTSPSAFFGFGHTNAETLFK